MTIHIKPGTKFGDLVTVKLLKTNGRYYWTCNCRCGKTKDIREDALHSGATSSCNQCYYHKSHPLAYKSWENMGSRCNNPKATGYENYGGRGIKITPKWKRFIDFLDDMGDPPICPITKERYFLDRIDTDKDYAPENCRWASRLEQNRNKRDYSIADKSNTPKLTL